jgi:NAD(P)-dependent dehydrogenase (short-subunit alcohol dehydrogenase family)
MKDFAGKIAFITGGASGAGLGQAKLFGSLGAKVTIVDIRQEAIDKAVAELKSMRIDVLGIQMDLTNRAQYTAAADQAEKHWGGPPQLLIQTAGVNTFGPAEASTFEDYDWVLGVNLNGVVNGMVIFVPRMIKAYSVTGGTINREGGHIGIVSSMGAFDGFATDAPYSVSKAAVLNLGLSYYDALKLQHRRSNQDASDAPPEHRLLHVGGHDEHAQVDPRPGHGPRGAGRPPQTRDGERPAPVPAARSRRRLGSPLV